MTTPTILLIEDPPEDARLTVEALASVVPHEQVGVCADGADALDFLHCRGAHANRNPVELPLFVLLNLQLPRVPGLDVLHDIRTHPCTRLLPVTVLSTSSRQEDVRRAAECGANSFVRKPADGLELRETLAKLARYWLELNVPPPAHIRPRQ